jgi:hypothetical protein
MGTVKAGNPAVKLEDGRGWRIRKEGDTYIVRRMPDKDKPGTMGTHFRKSVSSPNWTAEQAAQKALDLAKRFAAGENPPGGREEDTEYLNDTKADARQAIQTLMATRSSRTRTASAPTPTTASASRKPFPCARPKAGCRLSARQDRGTPSSSR